MRQRTEEGGLAARKLAFVVASHGGSLIGSLLRGLIEQRFPAAECTLQSGSAAGPTAASVTNVRNGHTLWVFASPPDQEELRALRAQPNASAIELGARREEIELALQGLEQGFPVYSSALVATTGSEAETKLTRREREVAHLVAQGMSNAEIAAVLGLSPHTVRTHLSAVSSRLGVTSRAKLASRVRELQL